MFDPQTAPRVFALPPGVDFPKALMDGLIDRSDPKDPVALARVELFVNTRRMQRRLRELFDRGRARLLPRIRLITDLATDPAQADIPAPVPPLRRRLELSQLITVLLAKEPDLAAQSAVFDLADSLATLFEEMQGEGVGPEDIEALDITDQSGHWARALEFIKIAQRFTEKGDGLDAEGRQRRVVEGLIKRWSNQPPTHPIIIAGSTGSRGTTELLMRAVAHLPQGALVLPGFDFDQPLPVWSRMDDGLGCEDHPQYRFHRLMEGLKISPDLIVPWAETPAPVPERNKIISLALRPAPVTDQWLDEGPKLTGFETATQDITLVEAKTPREEAMAIAVRLRKAAEDGQKVALISPDRMLTRQVTAALDKWHILPDDSAGIPLQLTPPGRFLRHIASLWTDTVTSESLLTLLKHPLCNTGGEGRGFHLLWTRELELSLRRKAQPFPTAGFLRHWADTAKTEEGRAAWVEWVIKTLLRPAPHETSRLSSLLDQHVELAEQLSAGPEAEGSGELWQEAAGREAKAAMEDLSAHAEAAGQVSLSDYAALIRKVLGRHEVRDRDAPHPNILIWGTLEARVQGADMVILGGLNEGVWPELPAPDPWLNRKMRRDAGLLLPERRVGLSAHDFQQAIAVKEVWLTRSVRTEDAETVPSRWLNRFFNLLEGLEAQGGAKALSDMRARGQEWLSIVAALEEAPAAKPAARPSPKPPVATRPRRLSVTRIKTLIRDPYAIYAEHILRLKPLDPLVRKPDAAARGILIHRIIEIFTRRQKAEGAILGMDAFLQIADEVLGKEAHWPVARTLWQSRLENVAEWFLAGEAARRERGVFFDAELSGSVTLRDVDFTLNAKADRMDLTPEGSALIYDYKTGTPPSVKEQLVFDKQLLLEAEMVKRGGFEKIGPREVVAAEYIGLGSSPIIRPAPLEDEEAKLVWQQFEKLIAAYFSEGQGYTARRAVARQDHEGPYDHLARLGEWEVTDPPLPEVLS